MPYCAVNNCPNRSESNVHKLQATTGRISTHRLPRDPVRRKKWIDNLELNCDKHDVRVCSAHFPNSAFEILKSTDKWTPDRIRLKYNAMPFPNHPEKLKANPPRTPSRVEKISPEISTNVTSNNHIKVQGVAFQTVDPAISSMPMFQIVYPSDPVNSANDHNILHWNVSFEFANGSTPKVSLPLRVGNHPAVLPENATLYRPIKPKVVAVQTLGNVDTSQKVQILRKLETTEKLRIPEELEIPKKIHKPRILETSGKEETQKKDATRKYVDRATSVSPERIFNCPAKKAIREHYEGKLKESKLKLKALTKKLNQTQKSTETLEAALAELASLKMKQSCMAEVDSDEQTSTASLFI